MLAGLALLVLMALIPAVLRPAGKDAVRESGGGNAAHLGRGAERAGERTAVVPVLTYHQLRDLPSEPDRSAYEFSVAPADFACQLDDLAAHGYTTITVARLGEHLRTGAPLPPRPVVITFDDGWASALEGAAMLRARGMVGTFFVCPSLLGTGAGRYMTWAQAAGLEGMGMEVGSHTLTHPVLPGLPRDEARREIEGSKGELESALGHAVTSFAFPYGEHDADTEALVAGAGYRAAVTMEPGVRQRGADVLRIRRINVSYFDDVDGLARKLEGQTAARRR